jgi:hypothetical protein
MARRTRLLLLASLSMLTAVAVVASSALAVEPEFHSEVGFTTLKGEASSVQVFSWGESAFLCNAVTLEGAMEGESITEVAVWPSYQGCESLYEGQKVNFYVDFGGCYYVATVSEGKESGWPFAGPARIECENEGEEIVVKWTPLKLMCMTIPPQAPIATMGYEPEGAGSSRQIEFEMALSNLEYETFGGPCGAAGVFSGADIEGEIALKGYEEEEQVGIWIE